MKKRIFILISLLLLSIPSFISCQPSGTDYSKTIIGIWAMEYTTATTQVKKKYEFKDDGTYKYYTILVADGPYVEISNGTYSISDNNITRNVEQVYDTGTNQLVALIDGDTERFEQVIVIEESEKFGIDYLIGGNTETLVGTWEQTKITKEKGDSPETDYNWELDLKKDGTFTYKGNDKEGNFVSEGSWTYENDTLVFSDVTGTGVSNRNYTVITIDNGMMFGPETDFDATHYYYTKLLDM